MGFVISYVGHMWATELHHFTVVDSECVFVENWLLLVTLAPCFQRVSICCKLVIFGDIGPLFSGAQVERGRFLGSITFANYHSFLAAAQNNWVKGPIIDTK